MKKYVFLALELTHVGGAQMYIRFKKRYLMEQNYQVFAFCVSAGSEDKRAVNLDIARDIRPELGYSVQAFSDANVQRIITEMKASINWRDDDEVIIESLSLPLGIWGEELARQCRARHIMYLVSEKVQVSDGLRAFMEFKCLRREVASIKPELIRGLYEKSNVIGKDAVAHLIAYMGDVVEDYECPKLNGAAGGDVKLCVFGRLSKPYVAEATAEIAKFCQAHSDQKVSVAYVGDNANGKLKQDLLQVYAGLANVEISFCGALTPLPKRMFEMFDVIIAGAGCANVSHRNGARTVAMNVRGGGMPLGLMGYDVTSSLASAEEVRNRQHPLAELLDKLVYGHYGEGVELIPAKPAAPLSSFDKHMDFVRSSDREMKWFDYHQNQRSMKEWVMDVMNRLLGGRSKTIALLGKLKQISKRLRGKH